MHDWLWVLQGYLTPVMTQWVLAAQNNTTSHWDQLMQLSFHRWPRKNSGTQDPSKAPLNLCSRTWSGVHTMHQMILQQIIRFFMLNISRQRTVRSALMLLSQINKLLRKVQNTLLFTRTICYVYFCFPFCQSADSTHVWIGYCAWHETFVSAWPVSEQQCYKF